MTKKLFLLLITILFFCLTWGCSGRPVVREWIDAITNPAGTETGTEKVKKPRYQKPSKTGKGTGETGIATPTTPPDTSPEVVEATLAQAREYMDKKAYAEIPPLTEPILAAKPSPAVYEEAFELTHAAYYEMGQHFYKNRKYLKAVEAFSKVSPGYRDTTAVLADIRAEMKQQADVHYKQGVKYFINEDLTRAMAEWQQTLQLDPDHPKAAEDIENAQELLEKLEKIE